MIITLVSNDSEGWWTTFCKKHGVVSWAIVQESVCLLVCSVWVWGFYVYLYIHKYICTHWRKMVRSCAYPNMWSQRLRKCWQFWSPFSDTQTKLGACVTEKQSRGKLILNSKQSSQCWTLGCIIQLGRYSAVPRLIQQLCCCSLESQIWCFAAIHARSI